MTCASLLAITACSGDEGSTTAESSPSATAPTAPASAAPDTAPPSTASAADVVGDKKLCQAAKKASDEMKAALVEALQSGGDPSPAAFKEALAGLEEKLVMLAATGSGDSRVAATLGKFSTEAGRAAAAADPATAADNPVFEKAGAELTAACKKAGVSVTF
nr:hypothetical protein [Micromonospora tarapacensis]